MSLKAKIEAVIYAAEEPVTLAQLVGLLGEEAGAELDRLAERQGSLALDEADGPPPPSEPDVLNDEILTQESFADENGGSAETQESGEGTEPAASESSANAGESALPSARLARPSGEPATERDDDAADGLRSEAEMAPPERDERQLARDSRQRERAVRDYMRSLLDELIRDYAGPDRGLEIREVASGFRLATKPECHDAVRGFARGLKTPLKLSLQALETLAVVAYKQPITAPEIAEIRGVDSGGVLGSLMARKLVSPAGRKQVIGRPILYKTTKDFLLRFGLKDVAELPSIEEFEKMAGDVTESDATQEEFAMPDERQAAHESITGAPLEAEKSATLPQADGDSSPTQAPAAAPVDGRLSGRHAPEAPSIDSSAGDAMLQGDEAAERERTQ